jgi:small subunit ribosomal protein S16
MATRIRLQRHGRSKRPYYYIVVADSRSRRDGKFIDRIGDYNPLTVPATINVDFEKAFDWIMKGAQPSETCSKILSYKGVLYKKHLARGVRKGALTEEQMETKMTEWLAAQETKVTAHIETVATKKATAKADKLTAETAKNAAYAAKLEAANTPQEEVAEAPAEEVVAEVSETVEEVAAEVTETVEETVAEAPAVEEAAAEVVEEAAAPTE